MAKVDLMGLNPGALPRIRGQFLVRPQLGGFVAAAWPPKRGNNQHPNSKWTSKQWGYAARMAANAHTLDLQTAIFMTKGTDWVPRDILMRAAFGTAYEIYNPDGTQWTVSSKSPPKARRAVITQWQFNQFDNAHSTVSTVSNFAFKGGFIRPWQQTQILASQAIFTGVIGASYRMCLALVDPANVIQEITFSDIVTGASTERRFREFNLEALMEPGETYALMVGRTDSVATYNLPCAFNAQAKWLWPVSNAGAAVIASVLPAVGNTISNPSLNSPFLGVALAF